MIIFVSMVRLLAMAASSAPLRPSAVICNRSTSRTETYSAFVKQLLLGCQFVQRLLVCTLRLLDETIRSHQLSLRHRGFGSVSSMALRHLLRGLLLGTVEPEQRVHRP